jgi:hypothetical protein
LLSIPPFPLKLFNYSNSYVAQFSTHQSVDFLPPLFALTASIGLCFFLIHQPFLKRTVSAIAAESLSSTVAENAPDPVQAHETQDA